ncbi:MAG: BrnT family toxin [Nitrospirae bacterium]|nr:MAG: BrnT family toxin [Nitrospirota bacterium]
MRFEWDRDKAKGNNSKHKVSFDEAVTVFYDPLSATFNDTDHSIEEQRFITIGYSSRGRLLLISHTERGHVIRIISARLATAHERKKHEG